MALGVFGSLSCVHIDNRRRYRMLRQLNGAIYRVSVREIKCEKKNHFLLHRSGQNVMRVCVHGLGWRMNAQYNAIVSTLSECAVPPALRPRCTAHNTIDFTCCSTRWRRISRRFRAHNILTCTLYNVHYSSYELWAMTAISRMTWADMKSLEGKSSDRGKRWWERTHRIA